MTVPAGARQTDTRRLQMPWGSAREAGRCCAGGRGEGETESRGTAG